MTPSSSHPQSRGARTAQLPVFTLVLAFVGDLAFVLGRMSLVFFAIRLGAETWQVLLLGLADGCVYTLIAGRFAGSALHRWGSKRILRVTPLCVIVVLALAPLSPNPWWLLVAFMLTGAPISLFWPAIHTRLIERVAPSAIPRVQGTFNVVWSVAVVLSYIAAGSLIEYGFAAGFGPWLAILIAVILAGTMVFIPMPSGQLEDDHEALEPVATDPISGSAKRTFALAAWATNFASFLVFDNARLVFPSLGNELGYGEGLIGWLIAGGIIMQTLAFVVLQRWHGWLYQRSWLYVGLALHLLALLLFLTTSATFTFFLAFACVGTALAMTYAASLFYSFGASESRGHASGRHEALIGFSRVMSPLFGAVAARMAESSRAPYAVSLVAVLAIGTALFLLFRQLGKDELGRLAVQRKALH